MTDETIDVAHTYRADPASDIRKIAPDLLAYFIRRMSSPEDAADAVSETLVIIWRKNGSMPAESEARRRYSFGIARKVLSAARRRTKRHDAISEKLAQELGKTAQTRANHKDVDLERAIDGLPARDRELVMLIAWDGFGVAEAGALIGLRPDAARARYSRARQRLRETLDP